MTQLISVIVPVYKAEKTIEKCANSITHQTYPNIELLLVDDGSPDNSGVVCDKLAKCDSRIKVIHKSNGGPSSARNKGIDEANGAYIVFVDADDWIEAEYVEILYTQLLETNASIIMSGNTHRPYLLSCNKQYQSFSSKQYASLIEDKEFYLKGDPWGKMFDATLIKMHSIKFPEGVKFGEDLVFFYKALLFADQIAMTSYSGYHYEDVNPDSLVVSYNSLDVELKGFVEYENILNAFEDKYQVNSNTLCKNYQWLLFFLMRSVKTIYRPGKNHLNRSARIQSLGNKFQIVEYAKYKNFASKANLVDKVIFILLENQKYKLLDLFLLIFFSIRYKFR